MLGCVLSYISAHSTHLLYCGACQLVFYIYAKNQGVEKKQQLIYGLIFGDETNFLIDIGQYVDDIYQYEDFVAEIRNVLRKSKVMIAKSSVSIDSKTALWELKVKK